MLIPAILKKIEIEEGFGSVFYTDDMMYEVGGIIDFIPDIQTNPNAGYFQYAVVNAEQSLIGYFSYTIDWYSSCAYNFGLISFEKGNPIVGRDVYAELQRLIDTYHLHRIEWRMVGGNPIEKHYDKFCRKYNGTKHVFRDVFKDKTGKYRDSIIYEILLD